MQCFKEYIKCIDQIPSHLIFSLRAKHEVETQRQHMKFQWIQVMPSSQKDDLPMLQGAWQSWIILNCNQDRQEDKETKEWIISDESSHDIYKVVRITQVFCCVFTLKALQWELSLP